MTGANFAALTQTNTKRLLAYSSIAHVGYMLLGLIAGTASELSPDGIKGILIYLLVYTFMNLGAFGVITSLRHRNVIGDELDDLNGLYSRAPSKPCSCWYSCCRWLGSRRSPDSGASTSSSSA